MSDRDRIAWCTNCERNLLVEWAEWGWRYASHQIDDGTYCAYSRMLLPPGVFTVPVPFDPEYDDVEGAGWIISDEYWG